MLQNETNHAKKKAKKLNFSGEYFESTLEVRNAELALNSRIKKLDENLKKAGCGACRDLKEKRIQDKKKKNRIFWKKLQEQL